MLALAARGGGTGSGATEAFCQLKERGPDTLCIAGTSQGDLPEIGRSSDLMCTMTLWPTAR